MIFPQFISTGWGLDIYQKLQRTVENEKEKLIEKLISQRRKERRR